MIDGTDPIGDVLGRAIRLGDLGALRRLLDEHHELSTARIRRGTGTLTPLHLAADWPGYFPEAPEAVRTILGAGGVVDARTEGGPAPETPLHWAASSDDVEVADALMDGGADTEATGGSIGTPLDNAIAYGCWHVARRLVERGARVDKLWHAAALGLTRRVEELLAATPGQDDIDEAFWQACHGGQRRTAERLVRCGANVHAVPGYARQPAVDIAAEPGARRELLAEWLRELGPREPT